MILDVFLPVVGLFWLVCHAKVFPADERFSFGKNCMRAMYGGVLVVGGDFVTL